MGSLALYDKFFLPAERAIEAAVNEQLMEIYRISRTFRRLFNRWKIISDRGDAPGRWQLMPGEKDAVSSHYATLEWCGLVREVDGLQQACYPIRGREACEGRQLLLYQMIWALMQSLNATEAERWAGASEYANLIMREMAWTFPSRLSYMSTLVISHGIRCPVSVKTPLAGKGPTIAAFPSVLQQATGQNNRKVMPEHVLRWSAMAKDGRLPCGDMSLYAKQNGVTLRALRRYVGASGILTNRGKIMAAQSSAPMDEKQLASYVRAWLDLPEEERWTAGRQKGYVRARGLTLGRWRHYVSKDGVLTNRGISLLARTGE